ncbi:YpbF family protein [Parageobacillus sp. VR-IP]|nr:YpbF family protein [Parageobacillus sp. VR-IP]NUK31224.1 YpbF family protein [Parageobacillus sp. VR-IP]
MMGNFLEHVPIDEVTRQMLIGVIEKKQKWERLKKKVFSLQLVTFGGFALFSIYILFYLIFPSGTWAELINGFLGKTVHLYILLLLFTSYWAVLYYKGKCDKAEEEFHSLRCEIIQKSIDLWKDEQQWKERHKLFEMMKKEYDINLYYENS